MTDYILEVPLSNEGRDIIVTDPDLVDSIISESVYMVPKITYNNLSIDSVSVDAETKQIYYGISASPAMKLGLATGDLAWYDILIAAGAVAGAIVAISLSAPITVPVGLIIVAGVALLREPISGLVEAQVTKARAKEKIVDATIDGRITPKEGNKLLNGVDDHWGSGIPWTTIIIGGMVGIGALAALYIYLKR